MNAKEEFLKTTSEYEVICAQIRYEYSYDENTTFTLNQNYTEKELEEFLNNLDFEYDSGYGKQYIYGIIWCTNGIWFSRHEYDGSECWEKHCYPKLPEVKPAVETRKTTYGDFYIKLDRYEC